MKVMLIVLSLFYSAIGNANECERVFVPNNAKLTITKDSDPVINIYHIRLPKIIDGKALTQLLLTAQQVSNKKVNEIVVPLEIKTKGELTGSYFYLSSNWVGVKVTGSYGADLCTEIFATLSM